jgi:hypothetical protein
LIYLEFSLLYELDVFVSISYKNGNHLLLVTRISCSDKINEKNIQAIKQVEGTVLTLLNCFFYVKK